MVLHYLNYWEKLRTYSTITHMTGKGIKTDFHSEKKAKVKAVDVVMKMLGEEPEDIKLEENINKLNLFSIY